MLRWIFIGLIKFYRLVISPFLPPACRFYPTCSCYCQKAFQKLPLHRALYLSAKRLLRCNPWGGSGYDPLP